MTSRLADRILQSVFIAPLVLAAAAAQANCATTVVELRAMLQDRSFPLSWEETGMRDARALLVSIEERGGSLFISFVKTGEGLLAQGPARVCHFAEGLQAQFRAQGLQVGAAASFMLKTALRAGLAVDLQRTSPGRLRIGTVVWRGDFVPAAGGVGLKAGFSRS